MTCSDGNDNGITLAASEENAIPIIRFLQGKRVKLEHVNAYGRTALMEVALWGRAETVKYLIDQKVDLEACDGNGMTAIDLAQDLQRNREERELRAGLVYREPSDTDHLRKMIAAHLERKSPARRLVRQISPAEETRAGFFHRTADGELLLFKSVTSLAVPFGQGQKAFASLDRGPQYPIVNSMSGYSHPTWPDVLDNSFWTKKVVELCSVIGHGGENPDRSHCSHAEKQLGAYFMDRHYLFLDQMDRLKQQMIEDLLSRGYGLSGEEKGRIVNQWPSRSKASEERMRAASVKVEAMLHTFLSSRPDGARIVVSKAYVCGDCKDFFTCLRVKYGVVLTVIAVSDRVR